MPVWRRRGMDGKNDAGRMRGDPSGWMLAPTAQRPVWLLMSMAA
jgi:hypothetical protein